MGTAAPMIFTAAMGAAQYQAQGKIGKYNQSVNNRNALVLEGQADQLEAKAEFDIAQFQKDFSYRIIVKTASVLRAVFLTVTITGPAMLSINDFLI